MRHLLIVFLLLSSTVFAAERRDIGLTQKGTRMEAFVVSGESESVPTVVLIGGLEGPGSASRVVEQEVQRYEAISETRRRFRLIAIPLANPERARLQFPPVGNAYSENAESHVLWRWIGIHAPDLVVVAGEDFGLVQAMSQNDVARIGRIPVTATAALPGLLNAIPQVFVESQARLVLEQRRERSPRAVAEDLARVYGHEFDQLTYLPGMALIGQLRLGNLQEVARLAERYLDGRDTLARASSLTLAGHLVFAELAERTKDSRYLELVRKAANTGFAPSGEMKESMPYHEEMSDSFFMTLPLLTKAGKLTGDNRYFDMAARHFAFMQRLDLRSDGLYRHSPLTDAAWSRGNAFPALGMALALSDFPVDHPEYETMVTAFVQHMLRLAEFQDQDGLWHEVIDEPGSYAEFSSTAMIGTAIQRGIRNGWLDSRTFQPIADRAWHAILDRTGTDGVLFDVCESTNKQSTLKAYLDRTAILDRDSRGGGMALIFATEMAGLR